MYNLGADSIDIQTWVIICISSREGNIQEFRRLEFQTDLEKFILKSPREDTWVHNWVLCFRNHSVIARAEDYAFQT